jgi:hypothetical protein
MEIIDSVFGFIASVPGWVWTVAVIALPAGMALFYLRWWIGRGPRWERAAMEMGFKPLNKGEELGRLFPRLSLFAGETPFDAETLWLFEGTAGGKEAWVGDFYYSVGRAKRGRTVCILRTPGADWPAIWLREGKAPRKPDPIAGDRQDPEFDRTFYRAAGDAEATGKLLTMDVRAGLVRLAARCGEIEHRADTPVVRLMLRVMGMILPLDVEVGGDAFAVRARRYLDPAAARELLAAVEAACGSLRR